MNQIAIRKSAVMERRELMLNQQVMSALDQLEKTIFLASTSKTISEYDTRQLAGDFEVVLKGITRDVGYRLNSPDEIHILTLRLMDIARKYYGDLTLKDIRLAFEMSLVGVLDDYLPTTRDGRADRGHYQQFSVDYFCKIVNAYICLRKGIFVKAKQFVPVEIEEIKEEDKTLWKNEAKRGLLDCYDTYTLCGKLPDLSPISEMLYYTYLRELGFAKDVQVTEDEQKEILRRTIAQYAMKGYIGDMNRLKESGTGDAEIQPEAYRLARRKALKDAFDFCIKNEIELAEYVKFE